MRVVWGHVPYSLEVSSIKAHQRGRLSVYSDLEVVIYKTTKLFDLINGGLKGLTNPSSLRSNIHITYDVEEFVSTFSISAMSIEEVNMKLLV